MPRYSVPEPKRGWQRAHQANRTNGGVKKSHVHYYTQSNGKLSVKVAGSMDSLARLDEDSGPRPIPEVTGLPTATAPSIQPKDHDLLQQELSETKTALAESKRLVEELRSLLGQRETELISCQGELKKSAKTIKSMERKIQQFATNAQQLQDRITELENQPAQVVSDPVVAEKVRQLEAQNAKLQDTIETQKESSTTILGMISSYQKKLDEAGNTINAQNEELKSLRQVNERMSTELKGQSERHTPVRRQVKSPLAPSPGLGSFLHSVVPQHHQSPQRLRRAPRQVLQGEVTGSPAVANAERAVDSQQSGSSVRLGGSATTGKAVSREQGRDLPESATRKRQDDYGTLAKPNSKRLKAEVRNLHHSNAEHKLDTTKLVNSPPNVRRTTPVGKRRSSPIKTPSGPTDSLARLGVISTKKPSLTTSSKRSLTIEIASDSDDSDSSDSTY